MKSVRLILVSFTLLVYSQLYAQCSFVPTVTPNDLILCPETTDTLWTQAYDSYQWMKEGTPISGANSQFLVVDANTDAGYHFSVIATQAGCTDTSAEILLDSYVFLLPYVILNGTPAYFGGGGEAYFCHGDTASLELGTPYTESIQWTDNGTNIPGANGIILPIMQDGNYSVSAAPTICPNFILSLGLDVSVYFLPPFVPGISYASNNLYALDGTDWQWYMNGSPVAGATNAVLTNPIAGMYYVVAHDTLGCEGVSDTLTVGTSSVDDPVAEIISIYPNPASSQVMISSPQGVPDQVRITDLSGKLVLVKQTTSQVDLGAMADGIYILTASFGERQITKKLVVRH